MLKILVTGGAGFIGSAVVKLALQKNYRILNFDSLTYASSLKSLVDVQNDDKYEFLKADLKNRKIIDKVFQKFQLNGASCMKLT